MSDNDDETLTISKPKKERTAKQLEATKKMIEASKTRAISYKKSVKKGIIEHLNSGVAIPPADESSSEEEVVAPTKKVKEPVVKPEVKPDVPVKEKKAKKEPTIIYQDASSSDEEEVIIVKKKKKKKKQTVIYEESSSEEEVVKPTPKSRETKTQQNTKSGFTVHTSSAPPPVKNIYYFAD